MSRAFSLPQLYNVIFKIKNSFNETAHSFDTNILSGLKVDPSIMNQDSLNLGNIRASYRNSQETFIESHIECKEPFSQFRKWFNEVKNNPRIEEPNAMCLATANKEGFPSARYVLLKSFSNDGFIFYTNYLSRKAQELDENPKAALVFYWEPLRRMVRVEGLVEKVNEKDSDEYFKSRPRDNQIGSSISIQSSVIPNRNFLINKEQEFMQEHKGKEIPRPNFWGGYLVRPEAIEFWQGQTNRIHDRIRFRKRNKDEIIDSSSVHEGEDGWLYERLSP